VPNEVDHDSQAQATGNADNRSTHQSPAGRDIELSVIVPSYNACNTIRACLSALERQATARRFEIIVVDSSTDGTATIIRNTFPRVSLVALERQTFPGLARNLGAALARGKWIAFIDADCVTNRDWIERALLVAEQVDRPLIGGAFLNGNPESTIGWGYYLCSVGDWLPYGEPRTMEQVASGCMIVARWAFEAYGPFPEERFCEDTLLCWRFSRAGYPPLFVPSIAVSHINIEGIGELLRKRFWHGRAFASTRSREQRLSIAVRASRACGAPIVLGVLVIRRARAVGRTHLHIRRVGSSLALMVVGCGAWALGELVGFCIPQSGQSDRTKR